MQAASCTFALLAGVLCVAQLGCGRATLTSTKPDDDPATQAGFFEVPADQLAHLKIAPASRTSWSVAIHTTGTVDWDQDHTTQAITQVNGPIARILVDVGTPVRKDQPLLYVSSPDVASAIALYRKARNREVYNKRIVDRTKEMVDHGAAAVKDLESAEADCNDALTDVQNSLQPLRIFGITAADIDAAEKQGTPISTELAVRSPIAAASPLQNPGGAVRPRRGLHHHRVDTAPFGVAA